ncbi:MAG: diguanylate cyclase [Proteobacteria bacterium]|nr:diguanylate cyclase [Pseudomonadota bacterium]MBU1685839.1 diguanylate cyclase [Pseudomonadota bacterium]
MPIKAKSILLVDDSPEILESLGAFFEGEGFENIHYATSAEQAIKLLGLNSPDNDFLDVDLILLDVVMPGMDGIEALRCIKKHEHFKDVPVVMVTKRSEIEVLQKAFAAGAIDYIVKPAKEAELLARVRSFMRLKEEIDQRKARETELIAVTNKLTRANAILQRLSYIDSLTGIGNRRYFDELFRKEWGRARREVRDLALVIVDIDFFKAYNDLYGHLAGDECLRQVAQAMADALKRPVDFIARFGGEEFAVVLPQTDQSGMIHIAEELMAAVAALAIPHKGSPVSDILTISLGLASMVPALDDQVDDLLAAADTALYMAKNNGRNRMEYPTVPLPS